MTDKTIALILGGHYAALPIARSLGKQGVKVYCHDQNVNAVAMRSRYVTPFCPGVCSHELLSNIQRLHDRHGIKPILYITADSYLTFLAEHGDSLRNCVQYPYKDDTLVETLVDKSKSDQLFEQHHIRIPKTWLVDNDLSTLPKSLPQKTVLKPLLQTDWTLNADAMTKTRNRKVLRFDNAETAITKIDEMRPYGAMAVQEFIPGHDHNLFYFVGYRSTEGKILVAFTGQKQRTLQDGMGSETLLSSEGADDVTNLGKDVLEKLNIIGPAGIDIKRNEATGDLYVIEINHRFGLSDGILVAAGVDLPMIYYRDTKGENIGPIPSHRTDIKWVWLEPELRLSCQSPVTLLKCIGNLLLLAVRGQLCINEISLSDPGPGLAPLIDRMLSRLGKGLRHA
jgi:D-aspartate ligase